MIGMVPMRWSAGRLRALRRSSTWIPSERYLNYLVRRYEQFKKWECDRNGQRMGWGVIRNAYKREMKYEVIHTPKEMFEDAVEYLQRRIRNTRLGRMKKCQRLYSEFNEFDEKASGKERLPVDD